MSAPSVARPEAKKIQPQDLASAAPIAYVRRVVRVPPSIMEFLMTRAVALLLAVLALGTAPVPAFAADDTRAKEAAASPEVKKELQKLKEAYGSGAMSAQDYKARKEALLSGKK